MRHLLLIILALLLASCGMGNPFNALGSAKVEPPAELVEVNTRIQPRTLWSQDVGAGTSDQLLNLVPWADGSQLYVAEAEGAVQALSIETGATLWRAELGVQISGGPGASDDLVLVGTRDADVIALDAATGQERWRSRVSSEVLSTPVSVLNTVVVHTIDGKLIGLNADDGKERWRYERKIPVLTLRGSGSPVISGATVICGLSGGRMVALDVDTGELLWDLTVSIPTGRSELQRLADVDGEPLVRDGSVFVATYQGHVAAIGELTGQKLWQRKLSAYSSMAADWRNVYVSDADGHVWALDADNGVPRWQQKALHNRKLSDVAVLGEYVVVGDFEGYLHWLSSEDGSFVARTRVGKGPVTRGVRVVDDVLYVQGDDGELQAISLPADK